MNKTIKIAVSMAFGAALFAGAPLKAFAQQDPSTKIIPSLEYQQADVREALQALFKNVGVDYSIAPEVQGQVTVSLRNVPFSTALQNILKQVDATYRIETGVWEIVKREEKETTANQGPDTTALTPTTVTRRIKIYSADPELIAMLIGAKAGVQNWSLAPEISSLRKGGGGQGGQGGQGGLGGGSMGGLGGGSQGGLGGGSSGGLGGGGGFSGGGGGGIGGGGGGRG
jgi:hypothetical protein